VVARDAGHVAADPADAVGAIARWAASPGATRRACAGARGAIDNLPGPRRARSASFEARGFWG
jgi:hypothetical protein